LVSGVIQVTNYGGQLSAAIKSPSSLNRRAA